MKNIIKFREGAFINNLLRLVIFLSIFYSSTAYALPNLTPFKPSTWSDKIVVSNTIGTNTDSSPLYTTDTLYIDWAVLNNGDAATEATFYIKLYVDGVEKATWVADLESYYYAYITDYSIGSLSQGTHTIKIVADTSNTIAEGNEADNAYTRTITVTDLDVNSPNLTPDKPSGWSDKIVVSNTTGTNTDSGVLYSTDTLYLDWAVINNGLQPTAAIFSTKLYVDGVEKMTWSTSPPLNVGGYATATDYSLGALSNGTHTIKIVTDTGGTIAESNETDNAYARVITVLKPGAAIERALVLLVDFSDEEGQESREYFQQMMFGNMPSSAPKGSFMDYYLEVSYGQFQVVGMVNNADVEWIRLPQTSVYYAAGCYGISKGCTNVYPQNAQRMVEDAVNAAKALGLDFGPYDSDNDGFVDSLFVIHAGRGGENSGNSNDIWSHKWATSYNVDTGSKNALNNTVYVRTYSTEPEYWYALHDMTIGVYAHEYGHILGLPDLYDTDYTSQGVGRWSLMAGGSWNGTLGDTPAHMDAWSKYRL
ncbi:MAG: M6 family metalloprotease domain-containing protein, partial [Nitrospirota bacterium]|nr:M6 family metalloprotease domain-containing protein [Nitrospirota bacterium]